MVNYIFAEFAFVSAFRDNSGFGLNILGPLCLWQCLDIFLETVAISTKKNCRAQLGSRR